ncbi:sirohydrochlorin ferrochelatase, chloroplastic-like [Prosopis cineraria]|uniref:sirohydrochlorin ferrochelatase, chloroplastic-like n=1 Tax=Prosopis cineraria TaxID=364024 RepID=UPI00240FAC68|nr:sirohydrochlorin ferrochelatase, chloroplastic-like [Prosopis cineraria]XP_054804197.1 sirohydrochlorin ferrochelatase, chloroplastic-like [Prosopis cineraria]
MNLEFLSLPSRTITRFAPIETGRTAGWAPFKTPNSLICSSKTRSMGRLLCFSAQNRDFREISGRVGDGDGVIIVDHGSRRKESNLMLNEFVEMFKHKTGYEIVEPAHMELAEPSIAGAFKSCIQQGARRIIVSPFFLFPGRHWHQDIPSLTAEAAKDHPGVSYIITAPLGLHQLLVDVVDDRIKHCLRHVAGDADECSICAGTGKCRLY